MDSVAALPWIGWQLSCGLGGRLSWNTHQALNEEGLECDGQGVETLGAGKGAGLLDQRVSKRGLLEKSLETLENGAQRPGFEVTVDRTDERY